MSDPYINPDKLDAEVISAIITRLEERANHPKFQELYLPYIDNIVASKPTAVLEIGCGTGPIIRQLECKLTKHPTTYQTKTQIHACDISQQFLSQAQTLAAKDSCIQWQLYQPQQALPYDDEQFDWIIMHTLLGHLPDPCAMLEQASQLLKPDGKIIIFDTDFLSSTFAYHNVEKGRIIDYKLMTSIAQNPDICRKLPQYIEKTGLQIIENYSANLSEVGQGDFWLSSVHGLAKLITSLNILEENEAQDWLNYQLQAHKQGHFFASTNYYTFTLSHKNKGLN